MIADFRIENNLYYAIRDIDILCTHYAKSETVIDTNRKVIYDVIPAKKSKLLKGASMGFLHPQVETSSCDIVTFHRVR